MTIALVLAGGGLAGIAWETGFLHGIAQEDEAAAATILAPPTRFVGTSAGATVAAQVCSGVPLNDLYERQIGAVTREIVPTVDFGTLAKNMTEAIASAASPQAGRQAIGQLARTIDTVDPADRRAVIAGRLPDHAWPDVELLITAVDVDSGELAVFTREAGVDLVDAVTASSAVPGVWPTVTIDHRTFMDGGIRSLANADLAAGADHVLVLVPATDNGLGVIPGEELAALGDARVLVVRPDDASLQAFGLNPLDPAVRPAAARAGLAQGRRWAAEVGSWLRSGLPH